MKHVQMTVQKKLNRRTWYTIMERAMENDSVVVKQGFETSRFFLKV